MFLLVTLAAAAVPELGELIATGDCETALLRLSTAPTEGNADVVALGAGWCLERMGQDTLAEARLATVKGPLAPYAALFRARARLDTGDPAGAATLLSGIDLPGDEDERVRARAWIGVGRVAEAEALLRGLPASAAVTLLQAQAAEAAHGDATPLWRTLWTTWPTSAEADTAAARLGATGHPVDAVADPATRAAMVTRARTLVGLSQAPLAIPLLDAVHTVSPPATAAEQLAWADALFEAHVYDRARDVYTTIGAATLGPRTAFRHALSTARAGDYLAAAPLYTALVARWPDAKEADEASWKPAYMDYDAGRLEAAITGFDRYLAARPSGKFAAEATWLRAWSRYKLGDRDGARAAMAPIAAGGGEFAPAAAYWSARIAGDDTALTAVARRYPKTSYAWFVAQRRGTAPPAATTPLVLPALPPALAAQPKLATARLLADAGFPELARPLLTGSSALATDDTSALALAGLYLDADLYQAAQKLSCPRVGKVPAARAGCTPRPYQFTVRGLAAATGLDPLLPYAIMNAESGLDPSVTSPAGARGLMQLMPLLAAPLAQGRVPGFVADDLYRAGVNARLGTVELGQLQGRFQGGPLQPSLPLVIAGYNGGAEAVQRWADATPAGVEIDRWAEDISYAETRKYVRRVLGYLMSYRESFGG